ncbi:hypothetical protein JAAARDRAFT_51536 [Jaapia argillacea MUCL 33604]|uniref:JmjC domain-containing protein n=1 Tax=Jaapia argillacea MUCL 33604 TaxID=933084 RepID=A0A067P500_9AGAM|nr:hypothetical protein JAAARDRAFT_51536 [Jaapia argillacea MUCL 33604]
MHSRVRTLPKLPSPPPQLGESSSSQKPPHPHPNKGSIRLDGEQFFCNKYSFQCDFIPASYPYRPAKPNQLHFCQYIGKVLPPTSLGHLGDIYSHWHENSISLFYKVSETQWAIYDSTDSVVKHPLVPNAELCYGSGADVRLKWLSGTSLSQFRQRQVQHPLTISQLQACAFDQAVKLETQRSNKHLRDRERQRQKRAATKPEVSRKSEDDDEGTEGQENDEDSMGGAEVTKKRRHAGQQDLPEIGESRDDANDNGQIQDSFPRHPKRPRIVHGHSPPPLDQNAFTNDNITPQIVDVNAPPKGNYRSVSEDRQYAQRAAFTPPSPPSRPHYPPTHSLFTSPPWAPHSHEYPLESRSSSPEAVEALLSLPSREPLHLNTATEQFMAQSSHVNSEADPLSIGAASPQRSPPSPLTSLSSDDSPTSMPRNPRRSASDDQYLGHRLGVEFPVDSETIQWSSGVSTILPFKRPKGEQGRCLCQDVCAVKAMAQAPDLLSLPPEEQSCLVIELRSEVIDPKHPTPVECVKVTNLILSSLAKNRPVLIRGYEIIGVRRDFSLESIKFHKGSVHAQIIWQDAGKRVQDEYLEQRIPYNSDSTGDETNLSPRDYGPKTKVVGKGSEKINLAHHVPQSTPSNKESYPDVFTKGTFADFCKGVENPDVCWNFLDCHASSGATPWFIEGLCQHRKAEFLNQDLNQALPLPNQSCAALEAMGQGNQTINPDLNPLPSWELYSHGGFVSHSQHDAGGAATWVTIDQGCKIWVPMQLKFSDRRFRQQIIQSHLDASGALFREPDTQSIAFQAVWLTPGDVLVQPPGIMYAVYTPIATVAHGGHFYHNHLFHLTEMSRALDHLNPGTLTNREHPAVPRLINNMVIALPNYWDSILPLRSFLALATMVLHPNEYAPQAKSDGRRSLEETERMKREEAAELQMAQRVIREVVLFNNIKESNLSFLLNNGVDWYKLGDQTVSLEVLFKFSSKV